MLMDFMQRHRSFFVVCAHVFLITISNLLAFLLRFDWTLPAEYFTMIGMTLPLILLVRLGAFHFYGIHHGAWRYASIRDLLNIFKAVTLSSLILVMIIYFFFSFHNYPRSVYIIDWLILILLMGGIRMQWRIFRELRYPSINGGKRTLLIGAGDAGEMILREMKQNPQLPSQPIGFIDDDEKKRGLKIHGVPVLGTRKELLSIAKEYNIEEIIITIASVSARQTREIVEDCKKTGLNLKIIPSMGSILNGHVSISQIREVRLEDLLYREVVKIDTATIGAYLHNKRVLVTGAAGSIGSELCRQIKKFLPQSIILFDQSESSLYFTLLELEADNNDVSIIPIVGDIQDIHRVKETMKRWKPDVIFHSAAYKHVPLLEQNQLEAVKNNIFGTRNIAQVASDFNVDRFILISTDKAVNPASVMGATKRVAELYVQELSKQNRTRFTIVRFGNVLGSNGSVIPLFKKQIREGGPVTVTHPEVKRYFMTISEAVQLIIQASIMGKGEEIFVLEMGEQIKVLDVAKNLIALSGYVPDDDIKIIFTGLRPGEKLYEELFDNCENVEATKHKKIMRALSNAPMDFNVLTKQIEELECLVELGDENRVLQKLKGIVSFYDARTSQLQINGFPSIARNSKNSDRLLNDTR